MSKIKDEVENKIKEEVRSGGLDKSNHKLDYKLDYKTILSNELYFDLVKTREEQGLSILEISDIIKKAFKREEIFSLIKNLVYPLNRD
jgi:hypothetical protein